MSEPRLSLGSRFLYFIFRLLRLVGANKLFDRAAGDRSVVVELAPKARRFDTRKPPRAVKRGRRHEEIDIEGSTMHVLGNEGRRVILYLHGGGYLIGPSQQHWSALTDVGDQTGADVAMFLYPRIPEVDHAEIIASTLSAYEYLATRYGASNIVVAGDSAGGGLTATLLLHLRHREIEQPHAAVLISPWLDLALSDPAALAQEQSDLMLTVSGIRAIGTHYAGEFRGTDDALISPVHASLEGLAPMHVFVGTDELFLADARTFAKRAEVDGAELTLREMPRGQHVAAIFNTREGRAARAQMAALIGWPA
jgi:acetyl esterase/lipase